MTKHPDVAIVGGGIIGLTSAYFLAKEGLSVEVFDRGDLGKEASWAGAGILPPGNPARSATSADQLRGIGSAQFPSFSEELRELTGIDNGYRLCGGIEFLTPDDAEIPAVWRAEGIAFERLALPEAKRLEPTLGDMRGEPYLLPACAQVRNPWHLRALIAACERIGVKLRPHEPVAGWITANKRVVGVRLVSGEQVTASRLLLAGGAWSELLLEVLGHKPRVHPVRGQIVLVKGRGPSRILMFGKRYLVPRGDGLILIGSTEEPEAGFEKQTTPEGISELLAFAWEAVPVLVEASREASWAGLRPGSPDGLPFIGSVPNWENVFVAAGHFRAGVQLSIGTAQAITELFTSKPMGVDLNAFRLDRSPNINTKQAFRS
ncbi:MAG: FAD-dependent oxidoreductase [Planctomycetia bacterium]|nr:FAD-dependent oxidoreductase [Planctomycetia bacterium]